MTLRSLTLFLLSFVAGMSANCLRANDLDDRGKGNVGAVYLMTNQPTNAIILFDRSREGKLTQRGTFPTGGAGGQSPSGGPLDPLASQGSLLLSDDKRLLFAVNAACNTISVMAVVPGGLSQIGVVPSGGLTPVSLTQHRDLLYVLNAGGEPNIFGFRVTSEGKLAAIPGSMRPLAGGVAAAPAQVGFSPDGDLLVVTEKNSNVIDTYRINRDGMADGPVSHNSIGLTPFGFAFSRPDTLIVAEAFGGAPAQAAASSYEVSDAGAVGPVSRSVADHQTAACWVAASERGRFAYVTNTGTGVVTGYAISGNGLLRLLNADGVTAKTGDSSNPIDMALTGDLLYVHLNGPNGRAIVGYRIAPDGSLTQVEKVQGLPAGAQGIAVR